MQKQYLLLLLSFPFYWASCQSPANTSTSGEYSPTQRVGGACESCELMYVGMPTQLNAEHSSPGWFENNRKLSISGRVFKIDGKTPAANIILYYWHTGPGGRYDADETVPEAARRHGRYRGWVKTDANGHYSIHSSRPAAYPNENIPEHIHLLVKEPELPNEYYVDLYFDDDPLYLPHQKANGREDRGGTELLHPFGQGQEQVVEHNIVLGQNVPNYPKQRN